MKIIPKFQLGGSYAEYFTTYLPIDYGSGNRLAASSGGSSNKSDSSKNDLTEKDLYAMMKDLDGLPNEMEAISEDLMAMLQYQNMTGLSASTLATLYITNLYKIKNAKFNKEQYSNAYDRSKDSGSLNDIAISVNGGVIVLDNDGNMLQISPELYVQNKTQYVPVYNSDLLWLRAHNPNYINNNQVFSVIENGIGLDAVNKMIKDRLLKIGKSDSAEDYYITREAALGSELLLRMVALGPDGYYKVHEELTKPQEEQITAALQYIYSLLPENARTRLKLETLNGTDQEAYGLIQDMLLSQIDTKSTRTLSYDSVATKAGASILNDKGELDITALLKENGSAPIRFALGLGPMRSYLMNPGSTEGTYVSGIVNVLTDKSGDPIPAMSSLNTISSGEWAGMLNMDSVSIAGIGIPESSLRGVLMKSNTIMSVDYPYTTDENGKTVPAISREFTQKKGEADTQLKLMGIDVYDANSRKEHYNEINQIYEQYGLGTPYDKDGNPSQGWCRFGVVNVYADSRVLGINALEKTPLLREVTDDTIIDDVVNIIGDTSFDRNTGILNMGWLPIGHKDFIYEGLAWIPVTADLISATNANARSMKISSTNEAEDLRQAEQVRQMEKSKVNNEHLD